MFCFFQFIPSSRRCVHHKFEGDISFLADCHKSRSWSNIYWLLSRCWAVHFCELCYWLHATQTPLLFLIQCSSTMLHLVDWIIKNEGLTDSWGRNLCKEFTLICSSLVHTKLLVWEGALNSDWAVLGFFWMWVWKWWNVQICSIQRASILYLKVLNLHHPTVKSNPRAGLVTLAVVMPCAAGTSTPDRANASCYLLSYREDKNAQKTSQITVPVWSCKIQ